MIKYTIERREAMRIISGKARGRKLISPQNDDVRPTGDRVKESIFNMIHPYISDSIIIDLFAGTGNLGLEAISRGAKKAYFVDNNPTSLDIVKKNIHITGFQDCCNVIYANFEKGMEKIEESGDVFFLDPPYNKGYIMKCIDLIIKENKLNNDGIIVAEHSVGEIIPDDVAGLELIKNKKYGMTMVSILRRSLED